MKHILITQTLYTDYTNYTDNINNTNTTQETGKREEGRGLNFNEFIEFSKPSSTNNCSQNNNNKVGDLKIYGTQSSAIYGTDDTYNSIHEQLGNRLP